MKRKESLTTVITKLATGLLMLMLIVLCADINVKAAPVKIDYGNDSISNAVHIQLNTTYAGNASDSLDEDWYHFVIPDTAKEGYFNIVFGPENKNSVTVGMGWNYYVYKKGEPNAFYDQWYVNTTTTSENIPFGPGEYYLKVVPTGTWSDFPDENYNFTVNFTDNVHWETERNDDSSNVNYINVNETYHGNLISALDEDWYTFTLPQAGEVVIQFGANASEDITKISWGWYLYLWGEGKADPYTSLERIKVMTSSATCNLNAGTYRIHIEGSGYTATSPTLKTYDFTVGYKPLDTVVKESTVTVSSAKAKAKKKVYLKWKKNKYADGYKVYRSTKKKKGYKCIATLKNRSKVSYTDRKVKSNRVYYYKVRAYKKIGKKTVYSGYSPVKRVKVK